MAKLTKLYFATDLHGSDKCFRKFLNASRVYEPDVMVLGGDVAGKAIQAVTRAPGDRYTCVFRGTRYDVEAGPELDALEQLLADNGYYAFREEPGELAELDRRGDLGILRDRQTRNRHRAQDDENDGDDGREDRAVDEEMRDAHPKFVPL